MPIYEYYCSACQGRFRHLAKQIDAPAPVCPRCGNVEVKRMISTVNTIHNADFHQTKFQQEITSVDGQDPAAIAQFLKDSGRVEDATGLYGSKVYRELLDRRAQGATDRDLSDLVDNLASEMQSPEAADAAGAILFSEQMENRMAAQGPPEDHESSDARKLDYGQQDANGPENERADDLGWA